MSSNFIYPAPTTTSSTFNSSFFKDYKASSSALSAVLNVNSDRDIVDVRNLTATGTISGSSVVGSSLSGTLQTAAQPNITSVGALTNLTSTGAAAVNSSAVSSSTTTGALKVAGGVGIGGALNAGGAIGSGSGVNVSRSTNGATFTSTNGTSICNLYHYNNGDAYLGPTTSNSMILQTNGTGRLTVEPTGDVALTNALSVSGGITGSLQTAAQPNITSLGTLSALTVSGGITGGNLTSTGATSINSTAASTSTTTGALKVNGGAGIQGAINVGGASSFATNLDITGHNGTTTGLKLGGNLITATAAQLNYTAVTAGTAAASKAIVLDTNKDINGVGVIGANSMNATTSLTVGGVDVGAAIASINNGVAGTATASKGVVLDSNACLTFGAGSASNNYIRFGGTGSAASKFYYDSTNTYMTLDSGDNLLGGLRVINNYFNFSGTMLNLKANSTQISFDLNNLSSAGYIGTYGSNLSICTNTTASNSSSNCLYFTANSGSIGLNTQSPASGVNLDINGKLKVKDTLIMGTQTTSNSNDLITCIDSTIAGGTNRSIRIGQALSNNNSFSMTYNHVGNGNSTNYLSFQNYGQTNQLCISPSGIGINTSAPTCPLQVSGSTSVTLGTAGQTIYQFNVASGTTTNLGIGPQIYNLSGIFQAAVQVPNLYYVSDRRLKHEIMPLDLTEEHYCKLNPVSFKYKSDERTQIGFIAQEMLSVCGEIVNICENPSLKKEEDDDLDGLQYSVDYAKLTVLNTVIIKKLIQEKNEVKGALSVALALHGELKAQLEAQQALIEKIKTYGPLAKFLAKIE